MIKYMARDVLKIAKDLIPGGLAEGKDTGDFNEESLSDGIKVELEHTDDEGIAREITMDHLTEDPNYYEKLKKVEAASKRTAKVNIGRIGANEVGVRVLEAYVGNFQIKDGRKKASVFLKRVNKGFDVALGLLSANGVSAQVSSVGVPDVWVVSTGSAGTAFQVSVVLSYTYGADYNPDDLWKVIPKSLKVGFKSVGIPF